MISYNKRTLSLLIALFASVALLNACDGKRERPVVAGSDATFDIASITVKSTEPLNRTAAGIPATLQSKDKEPHKFFFEACMIDRLNRSPILAADFTVNDGFSDRAARSDELTGCILWTEVHMVDKSATARVFRIKRKFTATNEFSGSLELELGFNVKSKEITDLRKITPGNVEKDVRPLSFNSSLELLDLDSDKAMLQLPSLSLKFLGHEKDQTKINDLLTLKLTQRYLMRVVPKLIHTNLENEIEEVGVRGGEFHITIVVMPESAYDLANDKVRLEQVNADNIVGALSNDARAIYSGLVEQDVFFKVHDIAAAQSRNFALVIVEPLGDLATHSRSTVFYGQIPPMRGGDLNIEVRPMMNANSTLLARVATAIGRAETSITGMEYLKQDFSPAPITGYIKKVLENKPLYVEGKRSPWSYIGATAASETNRYKMHADYQDLRTYCDVLYPATFQMERPTSQLAAKLAKIFGSNGTKTVSAREYCKQDPEAMISVLQRNIVEHVKSVKHVPAPAREKSININRSTSIAWSSNKVVSSNYGFGANASLGAEVGIGQSRNILPIPKSDGKESYKAFEKKENSSNASVKANAGVNISAGANYSATRVYSRDKSVNAQIAESQSLRVYSDTYEIDAKVRKCVIIQAAVGAFKGGYYCAKATSDVVTNETYHLVNHDRENSLVNDNLASSSSAWRMTIRSDESLAEFEKMMTSGNTVLEMSRFLWLGSVDMTNPLLPSSKKNPLLPDLKVTQDLPGALRIR